MELLNKTIQNFINVKGSQMVTLDDITLESFLFQTKFRVLVKWTNKNNF
jgi:hypothetical protein